MNDLVSLSVQPQDPTDERQRKLMRVFIEDSFDSAHFLPNVPVGHKCKNLHGHTYHVRLEVEGKVGEQSGWVVDYADVRWKWDSVKSMIDHKNLNDIDGLANSTCENVAAWIWAFLKPILSGLARIELRETANCGVTYEGQ